MAKIQIRRDTTAWITKNPILAVGEFGFEIDTNKIKIGDGVTAWIDLPYIHEVESNTEFGLISGFLIWVSDLTYMSYRMRYKINGLMYSSHLQYITLEPADTEDNRIDIIYGNIYGLAKLSGTPADPPQIPILQNQNENIIFKIVTITANSTEPNNVEIVDVYKDNTGQPDEFDIELNTDVAGGIISNNTDNPISGTDIKTIDIRHNDKIIFTGQDIQISELNNLRLKIKKTTFWNSATLYVVLKNNDAYIKGVFIYENMLNDFDITELFLFYETIDTTETTFNKIEFIIHAGSPHVPLSGGIFQLDDIKLETGTGSVTPVGKVGVSDLKDELKATFRLPSGSNITEYLIDWSLGIACSFEMTADTDFILTNIIENKVMTFELKGSHAFTITGGTILNPSVWSDYDGSKWNLFHLLPTAKGIYVSLIKQE